MLKNSSPRDTESSSFLYFSPLYKLGHFYLCLTHERKHEFAKFAIRFIFGIMKTEKEPSSNSTLM